MTLRDILQKALAAGLLIAHVACGPSYVLLEIHSELTIPDQIEMLKLWTFPAGESPTSLLEIELALEQGQTFPVEILLEPQDSSPASLRQRVEGFLGDATVAHQDVEFQWEQHRVNRARIDLVTVVP